MSSPFPSRRRAALRAIAAGVAGLAGGGWTDAAASTSAATGGSEALREKGEKVLRYAFRVAETSFDPAAVDDLYSRIVTAHVFEALYRYDPLARPIKIRPLVAADLPLIENDFRRWTIRLQPGIFFQDDPVFGGRPREVVAQDFVYAFKRHADAACKSPNWGFLNQYGLLGLEAERQRAIDGKRPFDYDAHVDGVQALDRYTIRFELAASRPRFLELLAGSDLWGAVAREVVEHYGDNIGAHPVGSGPFRLADWRRASRIVVERNPGYRDRRYDAEPAPDDVEGQAILARFQGRRLPMIDRVEIAIIEQPQPRWLSFLQGEANLIDRVPEEFIELAMPGGHLAPNLAKKRLRAYRVIMPDVTFTLFNMEDPVVGGYAPHQVALRRAIGLCVDLQREIDLVRHGQMIRGQSLVSPHTRGYDPAFKCEMSDYDLGRAQALLDTFGYVDRDGDGWRERPDGQPLELTLGSEDNALSRALAEQWNRNLRALGIRLRVRLARWPENLKAARAGKLQMWGVSSQSSSSDGQTQLERLYGPSAGGGNIARFRLPAFDAIYERMLVMPDGPERDALFHEAKRLGVAWMPYKVHGHRLVTDIVHPSVIGYRRPLFWQNFWDAIDIDDGSPAAGVVAR
jgi:ABC-type transport system substrate-binding protein